MAANPSAVRRLAVAGFVSAAGSEAAYIALAFALYQRTGSGLWVAAVFLLTLGIPGFFTPIAGVIADRFDRRRVMVTVDALAALAFVVLLFTQDRFAMLAVAFVAALVERPFGPALRASVPNFVDADLLSRANSLLSMGYQLGVVAGSALGGILFERYGVTTVFALNAASFLISSGLIASIRASFSVQLDTDAGDEHRGTLAGFRFIRARRVLLALLVAWALIYFAVDIVLVAEPALVTELGAGAVGYGLLSTSWGIGSIIGAGVARRLRRQHEGWAVVVETAGTAGGLIAIAVAPVLGLAILGMGLVAVFDQLGEVAGNSLIQRTTPDAIRGRVFAAYSTVGTFGNFVAFTAGGLLLEFIGPRGVYGMGAAASAVATIILVAALRGQPIENLSAARIRPRSRPTQDH